MRWIVKVRFDDVEMKREFFNEAEAEAYAQRMKRYADKVEIEEEE